MKPIRIQRKRTDGWKMPENTVYVGRPSRWGNPFLIGAWVNPKFGVELYKKDESFVEIKSYAQAVGYYAKWLTPYTHATGDLRDLFVSEANIRLIQDELRGKNLACWCALDKPCHADVLLQIANSSAI